MILKPSPSQEDMALAVRITRGIDTANRMTVKPTPRKEASNMVMGTLQIAAALRNRPFFHFDELNREARGKNWTSLMRVRSKNARGAG